MQDQPNEPTLDMTALITELELDKLSLQAREQVLTHAVNAVNTRVLTRIVNSMSEEDRQHIRTIAEVEPDKVQAAILNTLPPEQQAQLLQEEINAVKEEMKGKLAGDQEEG